MTGKLKIVSGRCSYDLAQKVAYSYGTELSKVSVHQFPDGEFQPMYEEDIRSTNVYIIQSTFSPSENFLELLMLIDAARRASARSIVAIISYFGYGRQDRIDRPRVSITARLNARLLSASGVNRVITFDLHSGQIEEFFDVPIDHLNSIELFCSYIKSLHLDHLTFGAKDINGVGRAEQYATLFDTNIVIFHGVKPRFNSNQKAIYGEIEGRNVIIPDDIVDTGRSICSAARCMLNYGAASVRAIVTHPLFSRDAYEYIERSDLTELVVTDSIPLRRDCSKIKILSTAKMLAEVITG